MCSASQITFNIEQNFNYNIRTTVRNHMTNINDNNRQKSLGNTLITAYHNRFRLGL